VAEEEVEDYDGWECCFPAEIERRGRWPMDAAQPLIEQL
jgi:hypothetical protein